MANHTPGPWTTRLYDSQIVVYGPKKIQVLATSWHSSIRASYPLKAESIANATLAAAAPDLLAVLQRYVAAYPAFRMKPIGAPGSEKRVEQENLMALEDAARAAFAKARGDTSRMSSPNQQGEA